jgi:hypothetical protein
MITLTTTKRVVDKIPQSLPVTCLRRLEPGVWRLKTATENGVKQTDFRQEDDLDAIEKALTAWKKLEPMIVGPIALCLDGESYFGLELRIAKVFPEGSTQQALSEIIFPWSVEPKR